MGSSTPSPKGSRKERSRSITDGPLRPQSPLHLRVVPSAGFSPPQTGQTIGLGETVSSGWLKGGEWQLCGSGKLWGGLSICHRRRLFSLASNAYCRWDREKASRPVRPVRVPGYRTAGVPPSRQRLSRRKRNYVFLLRSPVVPKKQFPLFSSVLSVSCPCVRLAYRVASRSAPRQNRTHLLYRLNQYDALSSKALSGRAANRSR